MAQVRRYVGIVRARYWLVVVGSLGAGCVVRDPTGWVGDDEFAPDHPSEQVRTTHIASDLVGTWDVRIPEDQQRKYDVLRAAVDGVPPGRVSPALNGIEIGWYNEAQFERSPHRDWLRCAESCRFEITDGSIWNYGFYPHSPVGSGLMRRPRISGREVVFELVEHDPSGLSGRIEARMNRSWTAFRVIAFELDGYRDEDLASKLELTYARHTEAP